MTNKYVEQFRKEVEKLLTENRNEQNLSEAQLLNEMATVCDENTKFSFIVRVYSNDHEPPHMHFIYKHNKAEVRISITQNIPTEINDIIIVDKNVQLTNEQLKEIVIWAQTDTGLDVKYWKAAQLAWIQLHPKN